MEATMKLNLRSKFLIPTLSLVIIGIGTSTLVSYVKSKNAINTMINDNMTQSSAQAMTQMTSWVTGIKEGIKRWSELDTYQSNLVLIKTGNTSFVNELNSQLALEKEQGKYFDFLGIADPEGYVVFMTKSFLKMQ
jgi:methyl-accepting chemotaxis protein